MTEATLDGRNWMLAAGLRACGEEFSGREGRWLRRLGQGITAGQSWQELLTRHGAAMPKRLKATLESGLATGRLPVVMEEYLRVSQQARHVRHRLWIGLAYPLLTFLAALIGCPIALLMTVPAMKEIFMGFGMELPGITILLIEITDVLLTGFQFLFLHWTVVIVPVALAVWVWCWGLDLLASSKFIRDWVPFFGQSQRLAGLSSLCGFLAIFVEGELPLPGALEAAATGVKLAWLRKTVRRIAKRVAQGEELARACDLEAAPREFTALCRGATNPGAFAAGLRASSHAFAAQAGELTDVFAIFIEPAMMIWIGGFYSLIVIGLFYPLIKLLNMLS